jgi:hypothetical protein
MANACPGGPSAASDRRDARGIRRGVDVRVVGIPVVVVVPHDHREDVGTLG